MFLPSLSAKIFPKWCGSEWMGFAVSVLLPAKRSLYDFICHIRGFGYFLDASVKFINTEEGSLHDDHLWLFFLPRNCIRKEWLKISNGAIEFSFSIQPISYHYGIRFVYKKDLDLERLHLFASDQFPRDDRHQDVLSSCSNR